jgi:hypothetical protein
MSHAIAIGYMELTIETGFKLKAQKTSTLELPEFRRPGAL